MRRHMLFCSKLTLLVLSLSSASSVLAQTPPPGGDAPVDGSKPPADKKPTKRGADLSKVEQGCFDAKQEASLETISKNRQTMIQKMEQLLRDRPLYDGKAEIFHRLAESHWDEAKHVYLKARCKYDKDLELFDKKALTLKPVEPKEDYRTGLDYYRKVIQQFPDYNRIDEVIYYLGQGAVLQGKESQDRNLIKEGVSYFQKLVQTYPKSKYIAQAHLALGEYFFETDSLYYAKTNYEKIINGFPNSPMFNYALYKLGWVYFNLREFRKTIETFQKVVVNVGSVAGAVNFREQALNDLVTTWGEMEDSWREALDYFKGVIKSDEGVYKKMAALATLYVSYDKDKEALELYNHFVATYPTSNRIPSWLEQTLAVTRKGNDLGKIEAEIRRILTYFDLQGTWNAANKGDKEALAAAEELGEKNLLWLGNNWHREAEKAEGLKKAEIAKDLYKRAASDYKFFIERFPKAKKAYFISFYYAEILYTQLDDYDNALVQYQKTIEQDKKGEFVEDAALGVIYSSYELMCREKVIKDCGERGSGPKSRKLSKEEFKSEEKDLQAEADGERKIVKIDLHKLESAYVKAADQYVDLLLGLRKDPEFVKKNPNRGEKIPEIMFQAAQTYYKKNHFREATERLQKIFDYDPSHKYAAIALVTLVELYAKLHDWSKAEEICRKLIKQSNYKFKTREQLERYIAIAIQSKAVELLKARRFDEALAEEERLIKEFKNNKKIAPKALMTLAFLYERAKDIKKSVASYERVIREFGKSDEAPEAQFKIGVMYESQTRFADAAAAFLKMEGYKANKDAPDAIWNAALIREAQKDFVGGIAALEKWLKIFGSETKREEVKNMAPHVFFKIGLLYERIGDAKSLMKAHDQYNAFAKKFPEKHVMRVEGYSRAGDILRRMDETAFEEAKKKAKDPAKVTKTLKNRAKATALFNLAVAEFPQAIQEIVTLAGTEKVAKQAIAQAYVAQAAYWAADYVFLDFDAAKIPGTTNVNLLKKALEDKGNLHQKAEKAFDVVLTYKDANWLGCAALRQGLLYNNFADELLNTPTPSALIGTDGEGAYRAILEGMAGPIQEKARILLQAAIATAHEKGVYNRCSKEAGTFAQKLDPEKFPVSGEELLKPDKTKDTLLSANLIRFLKRGNTSVDMLQKTKKDVEGGSK